MLTLACRTRCLLCGCLLSCYAFPEIRVNKRSLRQLPGPYLRTNPGRCPECGFDAGMQAPALLPGTFTASAWRLTATSEAEVGQYRLRKWPELASETA